MWSLVEEVDEEDEEGLFETVSEEVIAEETVVELVWEVTEGLEEGVLETVGAELTTGFGLEEILEELVEAVEETWPETVGAELTVGSEEAALEEGAEEVVEEALWLVEPCEELYVLSVNDSEPGLFWLEAELTEETACVLLPKFSSSETEEVSALELFWSLLSSFLEAVLEDGLEVVCDEFTSRSSSSKILLSTLEEREELEENESSVFLQATVQKIKETDNNITKIVLSSCIKAPKK